MGQVVSFIGCILAVAAGVVLAVILAPLATTWMAAALIGALAGALISAGMTGIWYAIDCWSSNKDWSWKDFFSCVGIGALKGAIFGFIGGAAFHGVGAICEGLAGLIKGVMYGVVGGAINALERVFDNIVAKKSWNDGLGGAFFRGLVAGGIGFIFAGAIQRFEAGKLFPKIAWIQKLCRKGLGKHAFKFVLGFGGDVVGVIADDLFAGRSVGGKAILVAGMMRLFRMGVERGHEIHRRRAAPRDTETLGKLENLAEQMAEEVAEQNCPQVLEGSKNVRGLSEQLKLNKGKLKTFNKEQKKGQQRDLREFKKKQRSDKLERCGQRRRLISKPTKAEVKFDKQAKKQSRDFEKKLEAKIATKRAPHETKIQETEDKLATARSDLRLDSNNKAERDRVVEHFKNLDTVAVALNGNGTLSVASNTKRRKDRDTCNGLREDDFGFDTKNQETIVKHAAKFAKDNPKMKIKRIEIVEPRERPQNPVENAEYHAEMQLISHLDVDGNPGNAAKGKPIALGVSKNICHRCDKNLKTRPHVASHRRDEVTPVVNWKEPDGRVKIANEKLLFDQNGLNPHLDFQCRMANQNGSSSTNEDDGNRGAKDDGNNGNEDDGNSGDEDDGNSGDEDDGNDGGEDDGNNSDEDDDNNGDWSQVDNEFDGEEDSDDDLLVSSAGDEGRLQQLFVRISTSTEVQEQEHLYARGNETFQPSSVTVLNSANVSHRDARRVDSHSPLTRRNPSVRPDSNDRLVAEDDFDTPTRKQSSSKCFSLDHFAFLTIL
jgi:hypothetical protein